VQINSHVWIGRKGYTLVTLDPEGSVEDVRGFNTSWSQAESHALAAFVRAIKPGRTVVVASSFDVSRALTDDAVAALATLGFAADLRGKFQWRHAGVGTPGAARGTAAEFSGADNVDVKIGEPTLVTVIVDAVRIS
jgi:hypothetical protein